MAYDEWAAKWRSRLIAETLEPSARAQATRTTNPAFMPRNHGVEQALNAPIEYGDFSPFAEMLTVLSRPYEDQATFADYANAPQAGERVFRTFCGTCILRNRCAVRANPPDPSSAIMKVRLRSRLSRISAKGICALVKAKRLAPERHCNACEEEFCEEAQRIA
jgi:hypothetical protein